MGSYTIAEAEAAVASMSGLSDNQRRQYEAEINEAKSRATKAGMDAAESIAAEVRDRRDDLLRDLCEVRDAFATTTDPSALADLRLRHQNLLRQVEEVEGYVAQVEQIEANPVAYGEALFNRFPATRPQFSF